MISSKHKTLGIVIFAIFTILSGTAYGATHFKQINQRMENKISFAIMTLTMTVVSGATTGILIMMPED